MNNSEIFFYVGDAALAFLLSLVGYTPAMLDPFTQRVCALVLSAIIWLLMIKFALRLVNKVLGFEPQGCR